MNITDLPLGLFDGANRYDTDTHHVLHLWANGVSFDLMVPKAAGHSCSDCTPNPNVGSESR